ncbi:hypothetical protein OIE68_22955 [Nocardia vinacea]|uniref:hypothetical protein n=1 Tax=Nocardia vinacea TaxID=96468 RepID=UPI002E10FF3F|nr:hypothetical protein OIE68_22955 [Nocardia vinacea]
MSEIECSPWIADRSVTAPTQPDRHGIPRHAAAAELLEDMANPPDAVHAMAARFGTPDRIVALHEFDLLTADLLRREFGIAGAKW